MAAYNRADVRVPMRPKAQLPILAVGYAGISAMLDSQPPHDQDDELERLEAEARYHRDRFELYRARVVSGSSAATSLARLRELERTATAAADRLAHARRSRQRDTP